MTRRIACAFGSLLLLAGVLTACATPAGSAGTAEPRGGDTASPSLEGAEISAGWLDGGRVIGLVTSGSSTCVPSAAAQSLEGAVLEVTLEDPADAPCTRDLVPRVTAVDAAEVDPAQDLEIVVSGAVEGRTVLTGVDEPLEGEPFEPSAGWTGVAGQFVFVTWGSSSCVPVIQDVAATGPAEVTVTFQTPPADQVCTADMAPRLQVATVDGQVDNGAELVLAGSETGRTPIVGSP